MAVSISSVTRNGDDVVVTFSVTPTTNLYATYVKVYDDDGTTHSCSTIEGQEATSPATINAPENGNKRKVVVWAEYRNSTCGVDFVDEPV